MKRHLRLTLQPGVAHAPVPSWLDIIEDKDLTTPQFQPDVDRVLREHDCPAWATHEYRPAGQGWSSDEQRTGMDRVFRLILQRDGPVPTRVIAALLALPVVATAQEGAIAESPIPQPAAAAMSRPTDLASREAIGLPAAHLVSRGSKRVTVAVLDTGVMVDHRELKAVTLPGFDFVDVIDGAGDFIGDFVGADPIPEDEVGHGTHVAGVIAAKGVGMPVGVVPECRVLPVRVLGAMKRDGRTIGAGLVDNINVGVKWAVDQGADVINMSLGIRHEAGGLPHEEVIAYAARRGVTVVAASGNDGSDALYYPSALAEVVAVGAADRNGEIASFSTWGDQVDLVAPGVDIFSAAPDGGYAFSTGTSHASPFVAGAAALLRAVALAHGRRIRDQHVKHILKHTADRIDKRFKSSKAGFGLLNLADAVRLLEFRLGPGRSMGHSYLEEVA